MGGNVLLSIDLNTVLSNLDCDITKLHSCNHAEADTRVFLHLTHAANHGRDKAYIRTAASDVVVLAIHYFETLSLSEIWMGFVCGKHYRDIPVRTVCSNLGSSKSLALPSFHSITGCDTTSQFLVCGKERVWAAWTSTPELTDTLVALTHTPAFFCFDSEQMQHTERFVVCTARVRVLQLESMRPGIISSPVEVEH